VRSERTNNSAIRQLGSPALTRAHTRHCIGVSFGNFLSTSSKLRAKIHWKQGLPAPTRRRVFFGFVFDLCNLVYLFPCPWGIGLGFKSSIIYQGSDYLPESSNANIRRKNVRGLKSTGLPRMIAHARDWWITRSLKRPSPNTVVGCCEEVCANYCKRIYLYASGQAFVGVVSPGFAIVGGEEYSV